MNKNQLLKLTAAVFGIMGTIHLLRVIFSWQATIEGFDIPLYFSYIFIIMAGYLTWVLYNASRK